MLVVSSLGVLALCADATAQCNYDVTVLEYPIDCSIGTVITRGIGMNEQGAVVGNYKCSIWTTTEAFLWTPEGGFSTLRRPPGVTSASAVDINEQGVICGTMIVGGLGYRGFVYENGEWTELSPVLPEFGWSLATAISNSGVVVGQRSIAEGVTPHNAFLWSRAGGFVDLGVMEGPSTSATAMNNDATVTSGWIGGSASFATGFLWDGNSIIQMGPVPDGTTSVPTAIDGNGRVCGWGKVSQKGFPYGVTRAFLWNNGRFRMLGTLPDHLRSAALDLNDLGQIVGVSWTWIAAPNISHALLWQNGVMTDLNTLISFNPIINITSAWRIGEDGTILARANNSEIAILTPIDPPVGDLDLDCRVGIIDFLRLLSAWGPCPETITCPADLNGDGAVDLLDFAMLLENWG